MRSVLCVFIPLVLSISCLAQEMESTSWEELFTVYRAPISARAAVIGGLGFDFVKSFPSKDGAQCHLFSVQLGTGLQGAWYETITYCENSKQVVYTTENTSFFQELKDKLVVDYGFTELPVNTKGEYSYTKDLSRIDITTRPGIGANSLSKHIVKLVAIEDGDTKVAEIVPLRLHEAEYHALIIGINNYKGISNSLSRPSKDAADLALLLRSEYGFSAENVTLINDTGHISKDDIIRAIESYSNLDEQDNLLVFFAGHGFVKGEGMLREGYWQTSDASDPNSVVGCISNSELIASFKHLSVGHLLIISDACFGGSILQTKSVSDLSSLKLDAQQKYSRVGREAISSAGLQTTPDNSVFMAELLAILNDPQTSQITAEELFIKIALRTKGKCNPVYGKIVGLRDNFGSFVLKHQR